MRGGFSATLISAFVTPSSVGTRSFANWPFSEAITMGGDFELRSNFSTSCCGGASGFTNTISIMSVCIR